MQYVNWEIMWMRLLLSGYQWCFYILGRKGNRIRERALHTEPRPHCLLAVRPWAWPFPSLVLSFLSCKMSLDQQLSEDSSSYESLNSKNYIKWASMWLKWLDLRHQSMFWAVLELEWHFVRIQSQPKVWMASHVASSVVGVSQFSLCGTGSGDGSGGAELIPFLPDGAHLFPLPPWEALRTEAW